MSKQLVHTPEGVRDIYGEEYEKKLLIQDLLHNQIKSYGFHDIQTPTFEFFDVFSREIGTVPSKELYKFFDKEGNTLVLRPDFTPSIARCAAKYFMEEDIPLRFCYSGNTFVNNSNLQGKLKESTQMGAELIGDDSVEADAEMISLVIESLKATGLKEFQVSIGEIEFFKGICEEFGIPEDTEIELRDLISNKNYFGAEELLSAQNVQKNNIDVFLKVTDIFGSLDDLLEAKKVVRNQRSIRAIERLEKVYKILCLYQVEDYVSFDLGMLSKYNYYTGIIFRAYTYGVGDAIVTGGRYDNLLDQFGKHSAAIGFMVVIDDLLAAISRQKITIAMDKKDTVILYNDAFMKDAIALANHLRQQGLQIELIRLNEDKTVARYIAFARDNMMGRIICMQSDHIYSIDPSTGEKQESSMEKLMAYRMKEGMA
ncbi:MAG: ATP phosphoribosyltransferase regulatory subunit [Lachnospiraceae bacterium]|nr:ATP phosphoribosyltransferase regulatory subunit [Lachnospiraceae bacterium]